MFKGWKLRKNVITLQKGNKKAFLVQTRNRDLLVIGDDGVIKLNTKNLKTALTTIRLMGYDIQQTRIFNFNLKAGLKAVSRIRKSKLAKIPLIGKLYAERLYTKAYEKFQKIAR